MDVDRAMVYAAEVAAFDGTDLEDVIGFARVASLLASVIEGPWWPGPIVDVRRARSDARSSSTRCAVSLTGAITVIRLADAQTTVATGAHELAHALAGVDAGHGPRFRTAYLDVVAVVTNFELTDRRRSLHVDQLAAAYAGADLAIGGRRWPAPPSSTTGAIAL